MNRMHSVEAALADVKSIEDDPDWGSLSPSAQAMVDSARQEAGQILDRYGSDYVGFAMRGLSLAIADQFAAPKPQYLERGMASTLRGIRNAFAEVWRRR